MTPFGGTIETTGSRTHLRLFVSLALALVASAGVLWIATGELLLGLAYSLGIAILLAGALAFQRMQAAPSNLCQFEFYRMVRSGRGATEHRFESG